jgi:hypothetical protein
MEDEGEDLAELMSFDTHSSSRKKQKTVLMVSEVDDIQEDFLAFSIYRFNKLSDQMLISAYSYLVKASQPIFSGNIDPIINKIDFKKLSSKYNISMIRDTNAFTKQNFIGNFELDCL